jgi:hypothetical protein
LFILSEEESPPGQGGRLRGRPLIYLIILLVFLSAGSLVLVWFLGRRFADHIRIQEDRLLRMERLVNDLFQEKTIGLVRQMQGRIRTEHENQRQMQTTSGKAWEEVEALFSDEDRNFSTALHILLEARRMYEERMKLLDRMS